MMSILTYPRAFLRLFLFCALVGATGCSTAFTPKVALQETPPYEDITRFSEALYQLGRMSVIYNVPKVTIQSVAMGDDTGASHPMATGGEIQQNISEIVKSTLNAIGGRVTFVEYDPTYINNQMATGYSRERYHWKTTVDFPPFVHAWKGSKRKATLPLKSA